MKHKIDSGGFNLVGTVELGAGATSSGMVRAHVFPGERKAEFTGSLSVSRRPESVDLPAV